jgi:cytochrome c biogenesis protein CcmG/thiol:disulfide interchange protein DsbE
MYYFATRYTASKHLNISSKPPAPDFSITDLDGQTVALRSYRGKVVLLNFWATWCEPCRKEIPRFLEFQKQYGPQGFQVLGVSLDDSDKPVRKFRDEFKITYPVVMGDAKLAESYGGVLGLPISFIIDQDGRIAAKHVGAVDLAIMEGKIRELLNAGRKNP